MTFVREKLFEKFGKRKETIRNFRPSFAENRSLCGTNGKKDSLDNRTEKRKRHFDYRSIRTTYRRAISPFSSSLKRIQPKLRSSLPRRAHRFNSTGFKRPIERALGLTRERERGRTYFHARRTSGAKQFERQTHLQPS